MLLPDRIEALGEEVALGDEVEDLEEREAHAPHVDARAPAGVAHHLGRHVRVRARAERARPGVVPAWGHGLCEPEVAQDRAALGVDENVARLDVFVDDAQLAESAQSAYLE